MSAHENIVEETIVERLQMAFSKEPNKSPETLFVMKTRLFDYTEEGKEIDNKNFFSPAIKKILDKQIKNAIAQIVAIHPPQFYAKNKSDTISAEIKEELLNEIEAIFLDQDGKVKQCYIDAFGGENEIQAFFKTIEFRDVNGIEIEATADPMEKFKSFLINGYYDHYKQELGFQIAKFFVVEEGSIPHIAKELAAGRSAATLMETEPAAYQQYLAQATFLEAERSLTIKPQRASLNELLEEDEISVESADLEPQEDISSLLDQSDRIDRKVAEKQPHFLSTNSATFFQLQQCKVSVTPHNMPLPEPLSISNKENKEGCVIS